MQRVKMHPEDELPEVKKTISIYKAEKQRR